MRGYTHPHALKLDTPAQLTPFTYNGLILLVRLPIFCSPVEGEPEDDSIVPAGSQKIRLPNVVNLSYERLQTGKTNCDKFLLVC